MVVVIAMVRYWNVDCTPGKFSLVSFYTDLQHDSIDLHHLGI